MRRVLRGRHRAQLASLGATWLQASRPAAIAVSLALLVLTLGVPGGHDGQERVVASIHITSPTGRSGLPGRVRIVARVTTPSLVVPVVRFYVNDELLATDSDGPPYAAEWTDENPFAATRIRVEMTEGEAVIEDHVDLKPFEVVEAAEVLSINVDASVRDAKGRYPSNLTAADFQLYENDVAQRVDAVRSESLPTTFALLIDSSQSMARNMDFVRHSVLKLPGLLRDEDMAIVAPFSNTITTITGPTRDGATLAEAVTAIKPGGGTAILESLAAVAKRFGDAPNRRAVVLVTDAYDENSTMTIDEVVAALKSAKVIVYTVAVGGVSGVSVKGEQMLRFIAEQTGGRAFFPWNAKEMAAASATIAEDAQHRYVVTYTPSNQRHDGAWRAIRLETNDSEYHVVARDGYLSPEPAPVKASFEFTVTNKSRQYVEIDRDNLLVTEDGVPQKVESFHESVAPVSVMLALDASGSMKKSTELVKSTASDFVRAVRPEDNLALITFADEPKFEHVLSGNREWSLDAIKRYTANGGTALYDALWNSLLTLKGVKGRRAIVLLSDGRDENNPGTAPGSKHTFSEVMTLQRQVGATVYVVGLGSNVDREVIDTLITQSGGQAYYADDATGLGAQFHRIVEDLRRRYVLSYASTNSIADGNWRKVEIRPHEPGRIVTTAGGYFAPTN